MNGSTLINLGVIGVCVVVVAFAGWAGLTFIRPAPVYDYPEPRPRWYRGRHRGTPQAPGATADWSPKQEVDQAGAGFTPTELLPTEPTFYQLADGSVIEGQPQPSWDALETDTHRVLDPTWLAMLADFRDRMDGYATALIRPRRIIWDSDCDVTQQWDRAELNAAVNVP